MSKVFFDELKMSIKSIVPITVIVLIISAIFFNNDLINLMPAFLIGSFFLTIGMTFFKIGADISMIEIGSKIGTHLTKKKNVFLLLVLAFIIGFIITVAEPDLRVLATQVTSISSEVLIMTVGIGVGIFLLLAILRMLLKVNFSISLVLLCVAAFVCAFFAHQEFVPLAFDSGGVTTGPISVPFIVALSAGLAFTRSDKKKKDDTFGIITFCSIGPVIIVLILGIIYNAKSSFSNYLIPEYGSFIEVLQRYIETSPVYLKEVGMAIAPIVILFALYNIIFLKLNKKTLIRIGMGLLYAFIGLSLFLLGVNVGFMPMGYTVGKVLSNHTFLIIPLSIIMGYFIVTSEPAVKILTEQIESITNGNIKSKILDVTISISVAIATGLSIIRVLTGISIWWFLLPTYVVALLMSIYSPQIFTAIAFDSGGVASGTMTATFLLPFAVGLAESLNRNVLTDAFGLIAIVSTVPLVTIQIVGIIYKIKTRVKIDYKDPIYNAEIIDY